MARLPLVHQGTWILGRRPITTSSLRDDVAIGGRTFQVLVFRFVAPQQHRFKPFEGLRMWAVV